MGEIIGDILVADALPLLGLIVLTIVVSGVIITRSFIPFMTKLTTQAEAGVAQLVEINKMMIVALADVKTEVYKQGENIQSLEQSIHVVEKQIAEISALNAGSRSNADLLLLMKLMNR